jgi:hypothetical protein
MDGKGRACDTLFTERLWRTGTYEEVSIHDYASPREARQRLTHSFYILSLYAYQEILHIIPCKRT